MDIEKIGGNRYVSPSLLTQRICPFVYFLRLKQDILLVVTPSSIISGSSSSKNVSSSSASMSYSLTGVNSSDSFASSISDGCGPLSPYASFVTYFFMLPSYG